MGAVPRSFASTADDRSEGPQPSARTRRAGEPLPAGRPPQHDRQDRRDRSPKARPYIRVVDALIAASLGLVFLAAAVQFSVGDVGDVVDRVGVGNAVAGTTSAAGTTALAGTTAAASSTSSTATTRDLLAKLVPDDGLTAAGRTLVETEFVTGSELTPKSVVYVPGGLMFAQNMMYSHTVTVYDRSFARVATIDDEVRLDRLGHPDYRGSYKGSPVEAAPTSDGRYVYVSNYEMYGPGFANPGDDVCSPAAGYDNSFLYRVNVATMAVDQAIEVGPVPKYVAVTPGNDRVLVSNWCGYDLSVVDATTGRETNRIPLGPYPRGIAVDPGRDVAYVAVMGSYDIARVDLSTLDVSWITGVGSGPRHLVMDPDGRWLYATLNAAGEVAKIDPDSGEVVARTPTGNQARSMAISDDGTALYVVNYESDTVAKVDTGSFEVTQTIAIGDQPIGIAYDPATRNVWVALYGGALAVLTDTAPKR